MKVCIIGAQRSRSSMLRDTISNFYNIPILGEDLDQCFNEFRPSNSKDLFLQELEKIVDNINASKEGVIRIHPSDLVDNALTDHADLLDFEMFNFEQYDRIFFTTRESISDMVGSLFLARLSNKFMYRPNEDVKQFEPVQFSFKDHEIVRHCIKSELVIEHLRKHLESLGIVTTNLEYDEVPSFILSTFPNTDCGYIETNYNYSSLIKNYHELPAIYRYYKNNWAKRLKFYI